MKIEILSNRQKFFNPTRTPVISIVVFGGNGGSREPILKNRRT